MKKILSVMFVCLLTAVFVSCGSGSSNDNSPRSVAENAIKCAQKKDIKGMMEYVYFSESEQAQKESFVQMLEEKVAKNTNEAKDIKDYEFIDETINEETGKAKENFNITYKDGSTKKEAIDLIRDDSGKWWIKMGK